MEHLVTITENRAVTTTLLLADAFDKQHKNVLRSIERLECSDDFRRLNFEPSSIEVSQPNGGIRLSPAYNITRDGFSFLAMGFTGKKAAEFKEKFIAAFNTMEQTLLEGRGPFRQININHSRRTNAPEGLDIKYTLDLTKLVMKPNRTGIELVERLTGIDMSDIVLESSGGDFREKVLAEWLYSLQPGPDSQILFKTLYASFQEFYLEKRETDLSPIPSRIWLSKQLKRNGYQVLKLGGDLYVWDVAVESGG